MGDVFGAAAPSALLVAAMHERDEGGFAMEIECTNAFRGTDFVASDGQVVDGEILNVGGELADGLYAVAVVEDAATVAELGDLVDGEQDAGFVVGPHEGDEGSVLCDGVLQVSHGEQAVTVHGEVGDAIAVVLF